VKAPTEKELQKLLDRIASDARKAEAMAKELWGCEAHIFCETDNLFAMDGDEDEGAIARQEHIRLTASGQCPIGGGAW